MKTERVGFKSLIRKYKASIKGFFFQEKGQKIQMTAKAWLTSAKNCCSLESEISHQIISVV